MEDISSKEIFEAIRDSLAEILDIEPLEIQPESYVVRDLGTESIDLLELSVALDSRFKVEIDDNEIYLKTLRLHLNEAEEKREPTADYLALKFPSLKKDRIAEILSDLEGGPVLKVKDLTGYIGLQLGLNGSGN
jgi:acyl carrier protein